MNITWSNIISLWSIWLVLLIRNIPFIIHQCDRSHVFLVVLINDLLNSVVRVLLSYGGSHWFKSNSRYILLDTRVKGMVSNKFFYSSSFIDFVSFPSYSIYLSISFLFLFFNFPFFRCIRIRFHYLILFNPPNSK